MNLKIFIHNYTLGHSLSSREFFPAHSSSFLTVFTHTISLVLSTLNVLVTYRAHIISHLTNSVQTIPGLPVNLSFLHNTLYDTCLTVSYTDSKYSKRNGVVPDSYNKCRLIYHAISYSVLCGNMHDNL